MSSSLQTRVIRWLAVLWPAFLVSIPLVGLVFTAFDPAALRWSDSLGDPLSPLAVYSLGFLVIWALVSVAVAVARQFPEPTGSGTSTA
jgi:hypothetical protein